ncbi:MAG TPA: AMP-binding protein [Micromonosporaceae bacterium]
MIDRSALLPEVLVARAEREPDAAAYDTLDADGHLTTLSHAQLASRASALAGELTGCDDGPVLVLYPAGVDYVVAVFAAFLAGRPVVPGYPPEPGPGPDRARLARIIADARPSAVVAPRPHPDLPISTVFEVPGQDADSTPWHQPPTWADVAIILYTSGTTGRPRGVLVRHDSVAANTAAIAERCQLDRASRGLTWLPPYYDTGLVGGLLTPLQAGIPVRIMPPGVFRTEPLSWLRQITESGATVSGAPNFAYELCVRRAGQDAALAGLDLSNWRVALNGGEPVRDPTMAAFAKRFAPVGFDPHAFLPCYGLAEATLIVSAGHWSGPSSTGAVVSCGPPVRGQRVVIVDPHRRRLCDDGHEGEIWLAGPHVTPGYVSGKGAEQFGELDAESFLRTGDRGYLRAGELFVTGRSKDVIVVRGVRHHAGDVEAAAVDAVGEVAGAAAVFLVGDGPASITVLVLEIRGVIDDRVAATVRAAVLARARLPLGLVALVPPGSVPHTASGKVQRSRCRDALLNGAYDTALVDDRATLIGLRVPLRVIRPAHHQT